MVRRFGDGRYFAGRESGRAPGMGRAGRSAVSGGVSEVGWLRPGGVGTGREPEIFTRWSDRCVATSDQTSASCAEPDRSRRKPAFTGGRDHQLEECGLVSGWQAPVAAWGDGGATVADL